MKLIHLSNLRKNDKIMISDEVEDDLIEKVKLTPCLKNKGLKDYRDAQNRKLFFGD